MQVSAVLKARSSPQMGSLHLIGVPPEGPSDHVLLEDLRRVLRIVDEAAQRARAGARSAARAGGFRAYVSTELTADQLGAHTRAALRPAPD
jgi:hypothetical protein